MAQFFQTVFNNDNKFKQQFDNISKICQKYLNNENINLFEDYKNAHCDNDNKYDYNKIDDVLIETLKKISEKYFGEVKPVNDTLKTFAEKFGIELKSTDTRVMINEIAQKEDEIRHHQNFKKSKEDGNG